MRAIRQLSIIALFIGLSAPASPAAPVSKLSFSPTQGVFTELVTNGQDVSVKVKKGSVVTITKIHIETEKNISLTLDDFNFDGHMDFSVSHLDDGMGTYTIYQIYVFSPKLEKFEQISPKCGDEFINISISRKGRSLTNSYFSDNELRTCVTTY